MRRDLGTINEVITEEVYATFKPVEGFNCVYYGAVRNGKTYAATADILELLQRGERVIANWKVDFKGYDQRNSFRDVLLKFLTGRRDFYSFDSDNFEYISPEALLNPDMEALRYLNKLVYVHVFIDEGQWLINSQDRNPDPVKLELILHGGHYCRSLNIITQRPSNIFKTMRSQVNLWYKCEKKLAWPFVVFQRTEFQMMKDDMPDETMPNGKPKVYFADQRVFDAYDTHAMRKDDADYRLAGFKRYETSFSDRIRLLLSFIVPGSFYDIWVWLSGAPTKDLAQRDPGGVPASHNDRSIRQIKINKRATEP